MSEFIKAGSTLINKRYITYLECDEKRCTVNMRRHATGPAGWGTFCFSKEKDPNEYEDLTNYVRNHKDTKNDEL